MPRSGSCVIEIAKTHEIGQLKKGDLATLRVRKFKKVGQGMLQAYIGENDVLTLTLMALGSHENFYRDLKQ